LAFVGNRVGEAEAEASSPVPVFLSKDMEPLEGGINVLDAHPDAGLFPVSLLFFVRRVSR
jgi:hypothetical protein